MVRCRRLLLARRMTNQLQYCMADPAGVDVPVRVLGIVLVLRNGRSVYNFLTHKTDGFFLLLQFGYTMLVRK